MDENIISTSVDSDFPIKKPKSPKIPKKNIKAKIAKSDVFKKKIENSPINTPIEPPIIEVPKNNNPNQSIKTKNNKNNFGQEFIPSYASNTNLPLVDNNQKKINNNNNSNNNNNYNNRPQKDKPRTELDNNVNIIPVTSVFELRNKSIAELVSIIESFNQTSKSLEKEDLIQKVIECEINKGGNLFASGYLEIMNDGSHGVLRTKSFLAGDNDVYIPSSQIKKNFLRKGDYIIGQARVPQQNERYLSLIKIELVNGCTVDEISRRPYFEKLTPIFPNQQIVLETASTVLSTRIIDILSPIGKGQRGMIVAPPKSGKTILLKEIATGIGTNSPDIHLMIVLIGERPEEVTDIERTIPKAEVMAANFDDDPKFQTKVAESALERAKRLVEQGKDVAILMDSLTRLARAYNTVMPASGRTLSGGMDPVALYPSKKFFGAARNFENGGSLTIIATALVETGSRMDDVVFEEFKGTGNMELKLDRNSANKKIYPAYDIEGSGTRNEELLLSPEIMAQSWRVRRILSQVPPEEATSLLISKMRKTKDNAEFLRSISE